MQWFRNCDRYLGEGFYRLIWLMFFFTFSLQQIDDTLKIEYVLKHKIQWRDIMVFLTALLVHLLIS